MRRRRDFSRSVDLFIKDFRKKADAYAQFYVREAGDYIVDATPGPLIVAGRTPPATKFYKRTGKLRGGWYLRINSTESLPSLPVDPTGQFTKAMIFAGAKKVTYGDKAELVNNVYYGFWVDQGTFKFEGRNMIGRTLVYLQSLKPEI